MEYLSGAVFAPYFDSINELIHESRTLSTSKGGLLHQASHASVGTIVGGVLGGPFGAMIGGIAGALIGFINVHRYSNIFFIFNKMADDERQEFMQKVQNLLTLNVKSAISNSVTAVKDSVSSTVSRSSKYVTNGVTNGVTSVTKGVTTGVTTVTNGVVTIGGTVISVPGQMATYVTKTTWGMTCATTNVVTGMVTENFMARYMKKIAASTTESLTEIADGIRDRYD